MKSNTPKVETPFEPMAFLKENRRSIIDKILVHHSKRNLAKVMTVVMEDVKLCYSEDEAFHALDGAIMKCISKADVNEFFAQQRESLKRAVFN